MRTVCGEGVIEAVPPESSNALPLVVDLDGTLLSTDLLIESALALIRRRPWILLLLPFWLMGGIASLKRRIARRVTLDPAALPWRTEFLADLRRQRAEGRSLILATGAEERLARAVAGYCNIFDLVLASNGQVNLCGEAKRRCLVARFGERGFDYASGGGRGDAAVWKSARRRIVVKPQPHGWEARCAALRFPQWMKNLLVFVPVIAAHRYYEWALMRDSGLAFLAFGLCASGGYLLNDLIDLEADRRHPQKKFRPLASGRAPLGWAVTMIPVLLGAGCLLGAAVSPQLLMILLAYVASATAYTLEIKKIAVLDVLFLAGLYTIRIMAGSAATGIWSSPWLLAFSSFLFFSLALAKRYGELVIMRRVYGDRAKARGYEIDDEELLAAMGIASGYLAVVVLALYMTSEKAESLYAHPGLLWILCPLLLYWISHIWFTAHRGKMEQDPIVFAAQDRTSRILLLLMAAAAVAALAI